MRLNTASKLVVSPSHPQIMAAQMEAGRHFRYRNVQIFKSQSLGVGSYGAVYRARCDQLPCAAKLIHPILANPGAPRNQQRFEQECQFLSGIRHPHIVQYLGTCRDPESGLPVLLMELMDDSLTHFLEDSRERLPYHLEVNLCHDVALALAYLHSNGIIHRDLSSNNVLLIAGSRAKVTDFGMSKLVDAAPQMTPLTQCPGTAAYMSPEAMREPPVYTDKLDCFAHGVMAIQIMTREFPNPCPASHLVNDPRSPTGTTSMPVLEPERRKLHIDRIDPTHPLLPIAIRCLSYNEKDRPSAQQLCHQLATLKEAPRYVESVQRPQGRAAGQEEDQRLRQELEQATRNIQQKDDRNAQLQRNIAVCEWEIRELQEQLREKDVAAVASQQDIQQLTQNNQQLRHELDQTIRDKQQLTQDTRQLREEVRGKNDEIEGRDRQLRDNEHIIPEFQQSLVQKEKRIRELEETISTREREGQEGPKVKQQQKRSEASYTAVDTIKLNWRQCPKAPREMRRGSAAVDGSMAYFNSWSTSRSVHAYDSDKEVWSQIPKCPQMYFTLAIVNGLLTAVGGLQSLQLTNTLLSLTGEGSRRKWTKHFPPMPTKRYFTAVVCSGRSLVVAGGDNFTILSTVEVMDTESLQWFTASSLPHPLKQASATICGENLYLLGGFNQSSVTKSVFTCSLSVLLQSCQPQSLEASPKTSLSQEPRVWQKTADIPVFVSTCTTLCGQLLAIGGRDSDYKPTTAIHKYDPVKNSWTVISHMAAPRWQSLMAVLPGDKLIVVGGSTSRVSTAVVSLSACDIVEIATLS